MDEFGEFGMVRTWKDTLVGCDERREAARGQVHSDGQDVMADSRDDN